MAYWDTSAILPLCVTQATSSLVRRLLKRDGRMIVWWGTPVELRSTLARLEREDVLSASGRRLAMSRLTVLQRSWREILPTEKVRSLAEDLPDHCGLCAADCFQLAAAVVWCRERPRGRSFICFDRDLAAAADRAGFSVIAP